MTQTNEITPMTYFWSKYQQITPLPFLSNAKKKEKKNNNIYSRTPIIRILAGPENFKSNCNTVTVVKRYFTLLERIMNTLIFVLLK